LISKRYYPVNLSIENRACLVVGGGAVAIRKVTSLLACGARVTVISPRAGDRLRSLAAAGEIEWIRRTYRSDDLASMFLVIGATNDRQVNRRIYLDSERTGKLCNIVDQPDLCNFILPSVVRRGDLIISISTSGQSPAFAKKLRQDLETAYGDEYDRFLRLMGAVRKKLLGRSDPPEAHKAAFEKLIQKGLFERIRNGERKCIDALLHEVLGDGFTYEELMGGVRKSEAQNSKFETNSK